MSRVVKAPDQFDFVSSWESWKNRWEKFRKLSGLEEEEESKQIMMLFYTMGPKSENLCVRLKLSDVEDYDLIIEKLDEYFCGKVNLVFERFKFFARNQNHNEPVEMFISDLYKLAERCCFKDLKEDLIMHKIIQGLADVQLSEAIQNDCLNSKLTLQAVEHRVRQSEIIKKQQALVLKETKEMDTIYKQTTKSFHNKSEDRHFKCNYCGYSRFHRKENCPAKNRKCLFCGKFGHFSSVCSKKINTVEETEEKIKDFALGEVNTSLSGKPWIVEISVNEIKVIFKVDTGADVSVISSVDVKRYFPHSRLELNRTSLIGPGGFSLKTLGIMPAKLKFRDKEVMENIYVIEGNQKPLLGRSAIIALDIVRFIGETEVAEKKEFQPLFEGLGAMKGNMKIVLKEKAEPYAIVTPRKVPIRLSEKVKEELNRMEKEGIITKILSPTDWVAGIVVVPKPNGKVRICVDYSELNKWVKRERFVLPSTNELLSKLAGAQYFTKLDCLSGYYQCKLDPQSALLTTFITEYGRYYYNRMPMGISSAPEHYHRRMVEILEGCEGVVQYLDDSLVFGKTKEEHDERLQIVLKKLLKEGITLNREKCEFGVRRVKFLGHIVSAEGIYADEEKVKAIMMFERPTKKDQLRRFLGMVNYQMKFHSNLASKTASLRTLLKNDSMWIWAEEHERCFQEIKQCMASPPVLAHFDQNKEIRLSTDASILGLGAVLEQKVDSFWKPIAYASRSLSEAEKRYSNIERECLAVVWACDKFSFMLLGGKFQIRTDHKPLVSLLSKIPLNELTPRLQRMRMKIMKFDYLIEHVPGKYMYTSDALSRAPVGVQNSEETMHEIDVINFVNEVCKPSVTNQKFEEIKTTQANDEVFSSLKNILKGGKEAKIPLHLKSYTKYLTDLWEKDGVIMYKNRILIPESMRREVLNKIHAGHGGIQKCSALASTCVWWPYINSDIKSKVENCSECLEDRRNPMEPLLSTPLPQYPWEILAMDHFKHGGNWYLVVADYFSRYIDVCDVGNDLSSTRTKECLEKLFSFFGVPGALRCDSYSSFVSFDFKTFLNEYGVKLITSSPRFPQSNGFIESMVKVAKGLLRNNNLQEALMVYRATPIRNGLSPAELLFGRKIKTKLPIDHELLQPAWPDLEKFRTVDKKLKEKQESYFNKRHGVRTLRQLQVGEEVWIKDLRRYGKVKQILDAPRSYIVQSNGQDVRRNRSHLIPSGTENSANNGGIVHQWNYQIDQEEMEREEEGKEKINEDRERSRQDEFEKRTRSGKKY